jgi:peptidoglycan hydrolase-like protein with peptidoglycan-binding domain
MQMTITSVTFLVGLALIIIAIFGGGVEIRELKIPTLPTVPRTMSFITGCSLIVLCLLFPNILQGIGPTQPLGSLQKTVPSDERKEPFLGAAIRDGYITVSQVKEILKDLKMAFQRSQSIEADGYVGMVTYGKLREARPGFFSK